MKILSLFVLLNVVQATTNVELIDIKDSSNVDQETIEDQAIDVTIDEENTETAKNENTNVDEKVLEDNKRVLV